MITSTKLIIFLFLACSESVTWVVFQRILPIAQVQVIIIDMTSINFSLPLKMCIHKLTSFDSPSIFRPMLSQACTATTGEQLWTWQPNTMLNIWSTTASTANANASNMFVRFSCESKWRKYIHIKILNNTINKIYRKSL